jgi:HAD superfamily hydrolase (TIGR01490 family)
MKLPMELALFDLDHTLLAADSDFEWTQFLITKGVVDRADYDGPNQEFFRQYREGTLDIDAFLDFQLAPLARFSREALDGWHREFMAQRVSQLIAAGARALVQQHLAKDSLVAIVTATNAYVTGPIARELAVPHLIATIPEQVGGRFTGKRRGTPAFREGKIERVEAWLESIGLWWGSFEASWFYSDSLNDLPLLARVTNPVAVDPDDTLRDQALAKGWPVISLRATMTPL